MYDLRQITKITFLIIITNHKAKTVWIQKILKISIHTTKPKDTQSIKLPLAGTEHPLQLKKLLENLHIHYAK